MIAVLTLLFLLIGLLPFSTDVYASKASTLVLCKLVVPPAPLTSVGLATPWRLQAPCHESDPGSAVFVQGTIFDPATKALTTYSPLVIDQGTVPAIVPVPPILPAHAIVGIWGGSNGDRTTLVDAPEQCVNGRDGRVFGQVFFCNAHAFFTSVSAAGVVPPHLGTGADGQTCPTVRSFRIVDQDQSDNVQTTYLATPDGRTAQNTAANRVLLPGASVMKNPSDNRVLSDFIDPALGCTSWMIPDIADNGTPEPTQATNELQAAAYQENQALIPDGDPMVGPNDLDMLNAYREGVDQHPVDSLSDASTARYCTGIRDKQPQFLERNRVRFAAWPSPIPSYPNLYAFMEGRLTATYSLLGCTAA